MNRSNHPNRTLRTIKNSHTNTNTKNHQKPPLVNKSNLSKASVSVSASSSSSSSSSAGSSSSSSAGSKAPITNQNKTKVNTTTESLLVFDDSDAETETEDAKIKNSNNTKDVTNKPGITAGMSSGMRSGMSSGMRSGIQLKPVTVKPISQVNSSANSSAGASSSANSSAKASSNSSTNAGVTPILDKKAMEAIYAQSIDLIYECDPDQNCSKEELIERLERKRDRLPENHPDIIAFNHLLKELLVEDREQKITNMNQIRNQQDLIVTKVKLKKEHFVGKTNLTPSEEEYKELGEDEQLKIFKTSKKFFEKVREYKTIPKNMADPFAKGKLRGNRKPPPELFNSIAAKFIVD